MPYLIDGHNLIPFVPGLNLWEVEDEIELIQILQEFSHRTRKRIEVFFDNAPAGAQRTHNFGGVTAHFIRQGTPADEAIYAHLRRLGGEARNWTVVSSDREIRNQARALHARVLSSQDFSQQLAKGHPNTEEPRDQAPELGEEELGEWLRIFQDDEDD